MGEKLGVKDKWKLEGLTEEFVVKKYGFAINKRHALAESSSSSFSCKVKAAIRNWKDMYDKWVILYQAIDNSQYKLQLVNIEN